jgi:hypothetical protein
MNVTVDGIFGLEIGFIDNFSARLVTTINYSAILNFHTLNTSANVKSFPACSVFSTCCLVTAPTMAIPASVLKSCLNGGSLPTELSQNQSYFTTGGLPPIRLGDKPLETHDQQFFFQLNTCGYSPYVTSSLMRGWICSFKLLLVLASAVILRPESRETHDNILLSQT